MGRIEQPTSSCIVAFLIRNISRLSVTDSSDHSSQFRPTLNVLLDTIPMRLSFWLRLMPTQDGELRQITVDANSNNSYC